MSASNAPARPHPLAAEAVQAWLASHPDWQYDSNERSGLLRRPFTFADFPAAFGFMAEIAIHAERMDHHPEWFNVHRRVDVVLTTHDGPGVTSLDLELAEHMERASARHGAA